MDVDPPCHHRRSIRLKGYDYSQAGAYFITIVTWQRSYYKHILRDKHEMENTWNTDEENPEK